MHQQSFALVQKQTQDLLAQMKVVEVQKVSNTA